MLHDKVGTKYEYKGQIFTLTGKDTVTNKAGDPVRQRTYLSQCIECNDFYTFNSRSDNFPEYPTRTCPAHRKPGPRKGSMTNMTLTQRTAMIANKIRNRKVRGPISDSEMQDILKQVERDHGKPE